MSIRVQAEDFDVGAELDKMRAAGADGTGALVTFTGIVRDIAGDAPISAMTLEHYPDMTERELAEIEAQALERWPLTGSLVIHRYGRLEPADNIVLVITSSAHRQAAFEAAEFLVDWLKTKAPFWKQESTSEGPQWVRAKSADDAAAARWELPQESARKAS